MHALDCRYQILYDKNFKLLKLKLTKKAHESSPKKLIYFSPVYFITYSIPTL